MMQNILTAGGVFAAISAFGAFAWKIFKWVNHQKEQDKEIERIEREQKTTRTEQALIVYGVLACLKGLKEQGCNGPVTEAISRIEKHLNIQAHQ